MAPRPTAGRILLATGLACHSNRPVRSYSGEGKRPLENISSFMQLYAKMPKKIHTYLGPRRIQRHLHGFTQDNTFHKMNDGENKTKEKQEMERYKDTARKESVVNHRSQQPAHLSGPQFCLFYNGKKSPCLQDKKIPCAESKIIYLVP